MKLRSKWGWPKGDFTVAEALRRDCDSDSRDSVERAREIAEKSVERAREIAEKSVEKLGTLVTVLLDRGVLQPSDLEAILPGYEGVEAPVTHHCLSCFGARSADGTFKETCGEPCSFIMGKGGSASPEWGKTAEGYRVNPAAPDGAADAPSLHKLADRG